MKSRIWLARITALLGGTLAGVLLMTLVAEGYYRWQESRATSITTACEWKPDYKIGFVNPPNQQCRQVSPEFVSQYSFNSDGNPDREFDPSAEYTVLALGDSHTRAVGVSNEQAWPKVAERLLQKRLRSNVQLINTGVGGFSIGQEYFLMERFLDKYKPMHVILGFTLASDAYDIRTPEMGGFVFGGQFERDYFDVENGALVIKHGSSPPVPADTRGTLGVKQFFLDHSALYRGARRGAIGQYAARFLRRFGVNVWESADSVLGRQLSPVDAKAWKIDELLLDRFRETLEKRHIGFTVVVIPYLPQVYDGVWNRTFAGETSRYSRFEGNERLSRICREHGLDCLDVTPAFVTTARSTGRWLHYPVDAHPTPEGQRLIGELAGEHLAPILVKAASPLNASVRVHTND